MTVSPLRILFSALFGLCLNLLLCGLAYTIFIDIPYGRMVIDNQTGAPLDRDALAQAAEPLRERGAHVALYLVPSGTEDDVRPALQAYDLAQVGSTDRDVIAVYVSQNPRYSEIRWGADWDAYLQNDAESIRQNALNPALQTPDYNAAYLQTLAALQADLEVNTLTRAWYDIRPYGDMIVLLIVGGIFTLIGPIVVPVSDAPSRGGAGGGGGGGGGGGSAGGGY